eukprot:COSAG06_NODE_35450_length_460_cov_0.573407_1_plen_94_part_01
MDVRSKVGSWYRILSWFNRNQRLEDPLLHDLIRLIQQFALPNDFASASTSGSFIQTFRFYEHGITEEQWPGEFPIPNSRERQSIHQRKMTSQAG